MRHTSTDAVISTSNLPILRWLSDHDSATASAIGAACAITPASLRTRLAAMECLRLVASRQDKTTVPPRRVFSITGEGRRAAGISDTKMQNGSLGASASAEGKAL